MKKYIVLIGEECTQEWTPEQRWEWNQPIREFLKKQYPQADDSLAWNGSGKGGAGYGISIDLSSFAISTNTTSILWLVRDEGYTLITRNEIVYEENLKKILEE